MADTGKQQGEPDGSGAGAASRGGAAAGSAARASADAPRQAARTGALAAEQEGRAIPEAAGPTRDGSVGAAWRSTQLAAEVQFSFVEDTADRLKAVGRTLAQAARRAVEDAFVLVPPPPRTTADGLQDVQQALAGLTEGMTSTNLRLTRELLRLSETSIAVDLQQRFTRECLGAAAESQAVVLRTARGIADRALRPVEQQLEQRGRGRQGADQDSRKASRVADMMSRGARVASPESTVQQAACVMREEDTGVLPVGEGDRLVGMVTDRDVALRSAAEGKDPARTKVREVMTPDVRYAFEDEAPHRAVDTMAEQQVRRLPVLSRDKRLVGIVSLGDLAAKGRSPSLAGYAPADVARRGGRHNQAAE